MTAAPTIKKHESHVEDIDVALIDESKTNPRKTFKAITELAENIKLHGILQAGLVRAMPKGRYELVFGARRLRAAKLAGLKTFPANVRELNDAQALELQLIENVQREDISALEEAEGFEQLYSKFGYTVDDIAAKTGKSRATIYARLKLCALIPQARDALVDGMLTESTALLVARVPAALQKDALKSLEPYNKDDGPIDLRRATNIIQSRFMLRLSEAQFDRSDAKLVPGAGPCTTCPKRSGNQPDLFADVESKDTCTDPTCFDAKKEAHWVGTKKKAEADGLRVLTDKEAKKTLLPYGAVATDSGFVDLDDQHYGQSGKPKKYRSLIGKDVKPVLARGPDGKVHELVPRSTLSAALKEKGLQAISAPTAAVSAGEKKRREAAAVRREAVHRGMVALVTAAEKGSVSKALWLVLAHAMIRGSWHDTITDVAKRREIEISKGERAEDVFRSLLEKMSEAELRALVIEFAVTRGVFFDTDGSDTRRRADDPHPYVRACALFKIDAKKIEADVRKERAPKKAKPKTAPKPSKKGKK